ncbi:MAG: hypothetical protein KC561_17425, partial [Myxococcales bacterium]|nr:hypothetical protein [Myxococcales bacterium]
DADRLQFSSGILLEEKNLPEAAKTALEAMKKAADGLLSTKGLWLSDGYDTVTEFEKHFGSEGFYRPCAEYFFRANRDGWDALNEEQTHQRVEEARLFIEEAEKVYSRIGAPA